MHLAHIQDFKGEEPQATPVKAPTSLQAVTETLESATKHPLDAECFVEGLFRRGYAVIPVGSCPAHLIFKGRQV